MQLKCLILVNAKLKGDATKHTVKISVFLLQWKKLCVFTETDNKPKFNAEHAEPGTLALNYLFIADFFSDFERINCNLLAFMNGS